MNGQPFIELAIGRAQHNPAAAWLWRDEAEILGQSLRVRIGGRFVWPPHHDRALAEECEHLVMIAAGMGIKYDAHHFWVWLKWNAYQ